MDQKQTGTEQLTAVIATLQKEAEQLRIIQQSLSSMTVSTVGSSTVDMAMTLPMVSVLPVSELLRARADGEVRQQQLQQLERQMTVLRQLSSQLTRLCLTHVIENKMNFADLEGLCRRNNWPVYCIAMPWADTQVELRHPQTAARCPSHCYIYTLTSEDDLANVDQLYQKANCKDTRENQRRLKDAGFLVDAPQTAVEKMYRSLAFVPSKTARRNAICR